MTSKITPKRLSKTGARGKDLDGVIREQVQIIDDKLLRSEKTWGRNVVSQDLPEFIMVPGLEKKDAQRIVYSALIREYDKRGFETAIVIDDHQSTLYLAYMTDLDSEEVEAMNSLIKSRRVPREKIGDWMRRGGVPAPKSASAVRDGRAPPAPALKSANEKVMEPRGGLAPAPVPAGAQVRKEAAPMSAAESALLNLPS
jgi:hypothetical protein